MLGWRVKTALKQAGRRAGFEVGRVSATHAGRRAATLRARGIDVVLDVGANTGQYARILRSLGYRGRIISFEPIPEAFAELTRRLARDPNWSGINCAVGATTGRSTFNVSDDWECSSMHEARPELTTQIKSAVTHRQIEVEVVALDDMWDEIVSPGSSVMLKADVQGNEHAVLDGVSAHLGQVELAEVEMGLVKLYEGGSTIGDLLPRLWREGFDVISLRMGPADAAGQVLDADVLVGRPVGMP